eukprot:tig00000431_g676.t1
MQIVMPDDGSYGVATAIVIYRDGLIVESALSMDVIDCKDTSGKKCVYWRDAGRSSATSYKYAASFKTAQPLVNSLQSDNYTIVTAPVKPVLGAYSTTTDHNVTISVPYPAGSAESDRSASVIEDTQCFRLRVGQDSWRTLDPLLLSGGEDKYTLVDRSVKEAAAVYRYKCLFRGTPGQPIYDTKSVESEALDVHLRPDPPVLGGTTENSTAITLTATTTGLSADITNGTRFECNDTLIVVTVPASESGVTSTLLGQLKPGTVYICVAILESPYGDSAPSPPKVISTDPALPPTVVWAWSSELGGSTNSTAVWLRVDNVPNPNVPDIQVGQVVILTDADVLVTTLTSSPWTFVHAGLIQRTEYKYKAYYTTQGADSLVSSVASAWTAPAAPVVSMTDRTHTSISLSITEDDTGGGERITHTKVERRLYTASEDSWVSNSDCSTNNKLPDDKCMDDTNLSPGTQYVYRARFLGWGGDEDVTEGEWSTPLNVYSEVEPPVLTCVSATKDSVTGSITYKNGTEAATEVRVTRTYPDSDPAAVLTDSSDPWETSFSSSSLSSGTVYKFKAVVDGLGQSTSADSNTLTVRTAPSDPTLSLVSAVTNTNTGKSTITIRVEHPSDGSTSTVISSLIYRVPAWVDSDGAAMPFKDSSASSHDYVDSDGVDASASYTYYAQLEISDTCGMKGNNSVHILSAYSNNLTITTPPVAPNVIKGPQLATTSSISVEIELPAGWEKSNGTELYRDGKLIVTLPTPGQCTACQSASAECCLVYEDKAGLSPGHAYNYTALLTVDNGGVRVTSPESPKTELWTALPAPVPVIHANTNYPSVTVNVSLPANLEDVVVATKCWENAATTPSLASLTNEPFLALFSVSNKQFVVTSTSSLVSMPSVDWATTYVWVCVYLGKGESRSEPGNVTVTLPPKAPVVAMTMVDSNTISVTVDIQSHNASKQLSTDYQLTCNDTNTARTVDIVLTGPATVTLAALQPSTTYSCWAKATSSAGDSQNSNTASATTDDSPKPTVSTTDVNATAVWVKVTLPALIPNVTVSGVRIWRATDENDASSWSAWEVVATVSSADADGAYRYVDGGRASQTRYRYKAVFLTPAYSKESDPQDARTGPPAPELTLNYAKAYEVKLNVTQSGLKTSFVAQTLIWRNDTRICTTGPDALDSCLDNSAADVSPGITYKYVAQYRGVAFYGGAPDDQKFGEFSAPLYVTTPLVVKPSITHEKITATTAEVCVTYPADDSRFEIKTTEFSRLYLPEAEVNTFSITRTAAAKDCKTLTGLEPATTSNITAHYTTTGVNSTTSDVLQVTQASPAAPRLSVDFDPAYPNATAVKVRVKYPTQPADSSMQTNPEEDLLPVVTRIDLYRNGSLVGSQTAVSTTDTYVFIDGRLAPGLLYFYEATLFTEFTNSPNKSVLAETDIAAKPTITATGIDRNTSVITLVVDHPVPEQGAAVTIRIHRSDSENGAYEKIAEIASKPEPEGDYVFTDANRVAGTQYWYKAEYTTFGEPDGIAGKDSELSVADGAWTAPAPPAVSLSSAEVMGWNEVTVSLHVAPSLTGNSVTGLVISRDDTGAIICSMHDSPQWVNGVVGIATCEDDDAEPAVTYTYTAYYVGEEELTSKRAHFNVTTPPEAPAVVKGPYLATTSSISVEIELPAGWEKSNGTELYRDGKLIVTLPTPGQCTPCQSASAECCLVYEDKAGLSPGHAYNYTALLTVDNGGVRVTSPESPKTELWTALPAPRPVIDGTTPVPSVTVNVSLPANLEDVVVATKCWENAATTPSLASLTNEPFMALFSVSNEQFVVTSTSNLASMPSVDWATTYVWVCVYLGKGESRSEPGNVTVTLPPKAPVVAMTMVDSNTINVTVDIQNHAASKQLSTDYQLTCNDTNTARTVDIVLTGPATVTLAALQPSTTYSCWAKATSSAGDSQNSNTASATTDDSPKPTVSTTDVNATAVWVKVTLPALIPNVAVSGVRIWRATDENDAPSWSAWEVAATVSSADADGAYRYVDGARASQTRYRYKAVFLTPAYSKESDPQDARTGPPAPELTLNYAKAYEVKLNVTQSGLKTSFVAQTLIWRNDTRICTTGPDALDSCLDNSAADVSPGITYKYVAQYRGIAFYGGAPDNQKFGEFSAPLYVTTPLVVKPSITHEKITATTVEVCVTYPADDSRFEIKTTEFSRLYLPEAEVNTFSITRTAAAKDCKTLTGLEPATTSNITAHYTTTGMNSTTSDVLQVTQASPAAPRLSVDFDPAYPNATAVKVRVKYPTQPADSSMQTNPEEDLLPVVTRIDLYRNGSLVGSQTAVSTTDTYVFIDGRLAPGLLYFYEATLFTEFTNSPNKSVLAETDIAAKPTITATGIDRNTSAITLVVDHPVPEQGAAVTIRIHRSDSENGAYEKIAEIASKPEPEGDYVFTDANRVAGTQYWYKAEYTTFGEPDGIAGKDSELSVADGAWTAPAPPAVSLSSAEVMGWNEVTVSLHVAPSLTGNSVTGLVISRDDTGAIICSMHDSPQWVNGVVGIATCEDDDAEPAVTYTYTAYYVGEEELTSKRAHFNVTTPPEAPAVVKGPYLATTSSISVEIELPAGWEKSNGTELYRDGKLIVTLPTPGQCTPCQSASAECCLVYEDKAGLSPGHAYNYTALLTVDNGGVRVTSPESPKTELWTALPAPRPVIDGTTPVPSVTVNVSLPANLEDVVVATKCWENAATTPSLSSLTNEPFLALFSVSNEQFVVTSTSNLVSMPSVDWATTYVWVCVYLGKGESRSEPGNVTVTLPPKAPTLDMNVLNQTSVEVTIGIPHGPSQNLSDQVILICNGTAAAYSPIIIPASDMVASYTHVLTGLKPGEVIACNAVLNSTAGKSLPSDADNVGNDGDSTVAQTWPADRAAVTVVDVNSTAIFMELFVPITAGVEVNRILVFRGEQLAGNLSADSSVSATSTTTKYTFTDVGLVPQTLYTYSVIYTTQGEPSKPSDPKNGRTAPTAPKLTLVSNGSTNITFSIVSPDLDREPFTEDHIVQTFVYRDGSTMPLGLCSGENSVKQCVDDSVLPGHTYSYTVKYEGEGITNTVLRSTNMINSYSAEASLPNVVVGRPPRPVLTHDTLTPTSVKINIEYPTDENLQEITETVITRNGTGDQPTVSPLYAPHTSDNGRAPGSTETYVAVFKTAGEDSDPSEPVTVTHPPPNPPALSPQSVPPTHTATSLKFRITMPKDGDVKLMPWITGIVVYRDGAFLERISSSNIVGNTANNWYDFTDSGLRPNGTYTYKALIETALINSSFSSELPMQTARAGAPRISNVETVSTTVLNVTVEDIPPSAFGSVNVMTIRLHSSNSSVALPDALAKLDGASSVVFTVSNLQPGKLYEFTADYTTKGVQEQSDGADSFMSSPSIGRTIPEPPVLALVSANKSAVLIDVAKPTCVSAASCSVDGATQVQLTRSPAWPVDGKADKLIFSAGLLEGVFVDTDVVPGREYTYHAIFMTDALTDAESSAVSNVIIVTCAPSKPKIYRQAYNSSSLTIRIESSSMDANDVFGANGTEIYRSDMGSDPVAILAAGVSQWTDAGCSDANEYTYTALYTTDTASVRVVSETSDPAILWTAASPPALTHIANTTAPSFTFSVPYPTNNAPIEATECRRNVSTVLDTMYRGSTGNTTLHDYKNGLVWATTYCYTCKFRGDGGTDAGGDVGDTISAESIPRCVTARPSTPKISGRALNETTIELSVAVDDLASHELMTSVLISFTHVENGTSTTFILAKSDVLNVTLYHATLDVPVLADSLYSFQAQLQSDVGPSDWSRPGAALTPPAKAPSLQYADKISNSTLGFAFTLPESADIDVQEIVIIRNGTELARLVDSARYFEDTGLEPGQLYEYIAYYTTPGGPVETSENSTSLFEWTAPTAPVVTQTAGMPPTVTTVFLSIACPDASVRAVNHTYVYRSDKGANEPVCEAVGLLTSCNDIDVVPGKNYTYTAEFIGVKTSWYHKGRKSAPSQPITLATAIPIPPVLTYDTLTPTSVKINIEYPADTEMKGVIINTVITRNGTGDQPTVSPLYALHTSDNGRAPGSTETYVAVFKTAGEDSDPSEPVTVTHPPPNPPALSPQSVPPTHTATSLKFRITMPKDGDVKLMPWITGIVVYRDGAFLERISSSNIVGNTANNWYDFTDSGLRPNGTYTYKALIETALINSSFSSELPMQTARAGAPRISNVETVSTTVLNVTVEDIPPSAFGSVNVMTIRLHSSNSSVALPDALAKLDGASSVVFTVSNLQPGKLYEFTADYTTKGVQEQSDGADSFMSSPSIGRTIPEPPVLALVSANKSAVLIDVAKPTCVSAASCSVDGATQVQLTRSPAWPVDGKADKLIFSAGLLEGVFVDTDVLPGVNYTYHAIYVTDVITDAQQSSASNYIWIVTSALRPTVSSQGKFSTNTSIKVTISTTADADLAIRTELFRNGSEANHWDAKPPTRP